MSPMLNIKKLNKGIGKFDTDTAALEKRIECHEKYGTRDLNEWIFSHLDLAPGLSVLDLGCGTGKQTLPIAKTVSRKGRVLAIDIEQKSLDVLLDNARHDGLERQIDALQADIDLLGNRIDKYRFDCVVASYCLYYLKNPRSIFEIVNRVLKEDGVFFFCGPSNSNNYELIKFHYDLLGTQLPNSNKATIFMEDIGPKLSYEFFTDVEIVTFENPIRFDSPKAVYDYWSSYNLYDEGLDERFREEIGKYFQERDIFETVKRVIGIRAIKKTIPRDNSY